MGNWRRIRKKTDLHSRFDIVRWMLGSALDRAAKGTLA
jgi:DNA-binding CsgD family transcriptional regulator